MSWAVTTSLKDGEQHERKCGKRNVDGHLRMGPHMGDSLDLNH